MPRYYDTGFRELERSFIEEERRTKPDLGSGIEKVIRGAEKFAETKRGTAREFLNTYAKLRQQGIEPSVANEQSKQITGYSGKDFVSSGFEQQMKRQLQSRLLKEELGISKELAGLKKLEADVKKTQLGSEKIRKEIADIKESGKYTKDQLSNATTLRKEFDTNKATKNYDILRRSVTGLRQAADLSLTGKSRIASDQALGVLFQKMLDPTSVVRESEYARTPEGASLINRLRGFLPKLRKGGLALANEDRKAVVEMGEKLLEEGIKVYNQQYDRYENLANAYGTDPKLIFGETLTKIDILSEPQEQTKTEKETKTTLEREQDLPLEREQIKTRIMVNPRTGQRIEVDVDINGNPIKGTERIL